MRRPGSPARPWRLHAVAIAVPVAIAVAVAVPVDPLRHRADGHGRSLLLKRFPGSFEDPDDLKAVPPAGDWGALLANAFQEMLAFELQRLVLLDIGHVSIAVMIRVGEFGEGVVVRRDLNARVVNLQLLQGLRVVIHNHPLRADHCHLPHFLRVQPTVMDERATILREGQIHHRHILDATRHMAAPLARDLTGRSSSRCSRIEMSCGARSHAT